MVRTVQPLFWKKRGIYMLNMAYEEPVCKQCGRKLTRDEIGLHKKMINRGATEFLCITCLAAYFDSTEEAMRERIEHFRSEGCLLFQ